MWKHVSPVSSSVNSKHSLSWANLRSYQRIISPNDLSRPAATCNHERRLSVVISRRRGYSGIGQPPSDRRQLLVEDRAEELGLFVAAAALAAHFCCYAAVTAASACALAIIDRCATMQHVACTYVDAARATVRWATNKGCCLALVSYRPLAYSKTRRRAVHMTGRTTTARAGKTRG